MSNSPRGRSIAWLEENRASTVNLTILICCMHALTKSFFASIDRVISTQKCILTRKSTIPTIWSSQQQGRCQIPSTWDNLQGVGGEWGRTRRRYDREVLEVHRGGQGCPRHPALWEATTINGVIERGGGVVTHPVREVDKKPGCQNGLNMTSRKWVANTFHCKVPVPLGYAQVGKNMTKHLADQRFLFPFHYGWTLFLSVETPLSCAYLWSNSRDTACGPCYNQEQC